MRDQHHVNACPPPAFSRRERSFVESLPSTWENLSHVRFALNSLDCLLIFNCLQTVPRSFNYHFLFEIIRFFLIIFMQSFKLFVIYFLIEFFFSFCFPDLFDLFLSVLFLLFFALLCTSWCTGLSLSPAFFICPVCSRSLKSRPVLMKHMKLHDQNRKIYNCKLCSYTCNFGFNLKRHIATVHAKQAGIDSSPGSTNNNSSLTIMPTYNF